MPCSNLTILGLIPRREKETTRPWQGHHHDATKKDEKRSQWHADTWRAVTSVLTDDWTAGNSGGPRETDMSPNSPWGPQIIESSPLPRARGSFLPFPVLRQLGGSNPRSAFNCCLFFLPRTRWEINSTMRLSPQPSILSPYICATVNISWDGQLLRRIYFLFDTIWPLTERATVLCISVRLITLLNTDATVFEKCFPPTSASGAFDFFLSNGLGE